MNIEHLVYASVAVFVILYDLFVAFLCRKPQISKNTISAKLCTILTLHPSEAL